MTPLRALIVDDERPARAKVRRFLAEEPDVEVVGECGDGLEAVEAIAARRPDLVFLDVQMPGMDGFAVLEALEPEHVPQVVFVTAYDQYALKAFEVHALDYLLKPFDAERFRAVVERAREQLRLRGAHAGGTDARIAQLLDELQGGRRYLERLLVSAGDDRSVFLRLDRVEWIEADRNYVKLRAGGETYQARGSIGALYRKLEPSKFLQLNRSQVVSIDAIRELQPWFHGEYVVILRDGTRLMWSRRYLSRAPELLGRQF